MSFIQQFHVSPRHTAVAMTILASVSLHGCKAGNAACTIPESTAPSANIRGCTITSAIPSDSPVSDDENEYGFTGGPMNASANLPVHMTE